MAILQLVDQLSEMLNQGKEVPLSRYRMVDATAFEQMLERMRISVPSSVREGERTLAERDRILAEARSQAEAIIAEAQTRAQNMLKDDQLLAIANREAEQIIENGRKSARDQRAEADEYASSVLSDLLDRLQNASKQIENGLQVLKSKS
ncbi:MAG: ATP synthase F0 subunit B [Chloroflexota bacterium]